MNRIKNVHDWVQPIMNTKFETHQILFRIYHTPKPTLWQRVWGWLR
ncbi:hypothetical protein RA086_05435 [Lactiplantibacillus sp. WILCCON 0030]|uniref:Uncharacterized protein n=1 Tax=Lactiplantibacillus brownii TaxID=3069269 RepID=A0ABU1A7Y7_9LACO|nr:hypothetical protein [Lactiplantibacillus brownii]MDQ7937069.1 hypothetical protein [Lactiplantibacillus brownii]